MQRKINQLVEAAGGGDVQLGEFSVGQPPSMAELRRLGGDCADCGVRPQSELSPEPLLRRFQVAHQTLKAAAALGDYVIVGVHSDRVVNETRGANYPILNMHERVLSVLGCKYVDDVLLDAPWTVTRDMIKSLKITVVAHGTTVQTADAAVHTSPNGRNAVPISLNIFHTITSKSELTVGGIVDRIKSQEARFKEKFEKKMAKENAYYADRYGDEGEDHATKKDK